MTTEPYVIPAPVVEQHRDITVVRDDLVPGGTKLRYLLPLFEQYDEVVYATPAVGGAQLALAHAARLTGKRATLFVAKRKDLHPRTLEAQRAGATIHQVPYGYLTVVQSAAAKYCAAHPDAHYLQFGARSPEAIQAIASVARYVHDTHGPFDQVWSAAGSGVLSRGLQLGFPESTAIHAVQVGAAIRDLGRATLHTVPLRFEQRSKCPTPFPSCPHYDAKAWEACTIKRHGRTLFWNVLGSL